MDLESGLQIPQTLFCIENLVEICRRFSILYWIFVSKILCSMIRMSSSLK